MKIYFKTEGGFGFFPGLNAPLELNSEQLSTEEAAHVKQLVSEADFFQLPSESEAPTRGADQKKYKIEVEDSGRKHWVEVTDSHVAPSLQNLLAYLSQKQREHCGR